MTLGAADMVCWTGVTGYALGFWACEDLNSRVITMLKFDVHLYIFTSKV